MQIAQASDGAGDVQGAGDQPAGGIELNDDDLRAQRAGFGQPAHEDIARVVIDLAANGNHGGRLCLHGLGERIRLRTGCR